MRPPSRSPRHSATSQPARVISPAEHWPPRAPSAAEPVERPGWAGRLLPVDIASMGRYELDGTITCVAAWGAPATRFPVGSRSKLEGENLVTIVLETASPARVDHFAHASGPIGVAGRRSGFHSAVGTPIVVEGGVWGVMTVASTVANRPLPPDIEARLASFTELVSTAVANAESRTGLAQLAEEQAALRRVA